MSHQKCFVFRLGRASRPVSCTAELLSQVTSRCVQKKGASEASVHPGLAKVEDRSWPSLTIELGWTPLAKIDMFVLFVPTAATLGYIRWHSMTPVLGAPGRKSMVDCQGFGRPPWDPLPAGPDVRHQVA